MLRNYLIMVSAEAAVGCGFSFMNKAHGSVTLY